MPLQDTSQTTRTLQKKAQVLINFHTQNPYKQICGPRGTTPAGVLTEMRNYQGPLEIVPSTGTIPSVSSTSFTQTGYENPPFVSFIGNIINNGGAPITSMGVVYSQSDNNPTLSDGLVVLSGTTQSGSFSLSFFAADYLQTYGRTYATNSAGTAYGDVLTLDLLPPTAPGAPTTVTGVAGNTQVTVSWVAPLSNGGSSITGYIITSNPSAGNSPVTVGNVTSGIVTGLTNGTSYTFTVAAINSVDTGPSSDTSDPVTPVTTPGAPTTVTGVAGNTQVTVSWVAPTSTGGSPITGYIITSNPSAGDSPVTVGNVTSGIVTGLTNGTPYTFTVAAVNSIDTGPSSEASDPVTPATTPTVSSTSYTQTVFGQPSSVQFIGNIDDNGGATITSMGAVFSYSPNTNPTLLDTVGEFTPTIQSGSFTLNGPPGGVIYNGDTYARTYATNSVGTVYGTSLNLNISICLAKGTLITLFNGLKKAIENIVYTDTILVWDFDLGVFSLAQPLWIKKVETSNHYNLLKFSDGTCLKTINQHRIFNKEKGMFTYPMTGDTPVGTTTFNDSGIEVILVSKEVVVEEVEYYNIITNKHMNLFADGILTSCRYNNIYPIVSMKFIKENRPVVSKSEYPARIGAYYEGLRLAEQTIPIEDTIIYVDRLERLKL